VGCQNSATAAELVSWATRSDQPDEAAEGRAVLAPVLCQHGAGPRKVKGRYAGGQSQVHGDV